MRESDAWLEARKIRVQAWHREKIELNIRRGGAIMDFIDIWSRASFARSLSQSNGRAVRDAFLLHSA